MEQALGMEKENPKVGIRIRIRLPVAAENESGRLESKSRVEVRYNLPSTSSLPNTYLTSKTTAWRLQS